jgi:uncharacterized membrane protein SpoIIM required for sporulation
MTADEFIAQRSSSWRELEELLQQARASLSSLTTKDVERLGFLYRTATADLALAQRDFPRHRLTIYLNQLVGRAHAAIYREQPLRWKQVRDFVLVGYPALYRKVRPWTRVAALLFYLPALVLFFVTWQYPETIYLVMGDSYEVRELVAMVEAGELWTEIAPEERSIASTAILTNNIQVIFLCFAGGIFAGVGTALVLISNGNQIGALFGLLQANGMAMGLLDFVVAHGFIELSVIVLSGGVGLFMGDGLVRPGLRSRLEVLGERARIGALLMLGSAPLLVIAGLIEGFISPSGLPFWVKLGVGISTGIALHWYWLRVGRTEETTLASLQPQHIATTAAPQPIS